MIIAIGLIIFITLYSLFTFFALQEVNIYWIIIALCAGQYIYVGGLHEILKMVPLCQ